MNEILENLKIYIGDWNKLDEFRLNWWLNYPLYLPIGFFLEMRNFNKKHRLTEEYNKKLKQYILK